MNFILHFNMGPTGLSMLLDSGISCVPMLLAQSIYCGFMALVTCLSCVALSRTCVFKGSYYFIIIGPLKTAKVDLIAVQVSENTKAPPLWSSDQVAVMTSSS